jgi:hypothetical protein
VPLFFLSAHAARDDAYEVEIPGAAPDPATNAHIDLVLSP